jgi:hypothetical protein
MRDLENDLRKYQDGMGSIDSDPSRRASPTKPSLWLVATLALGMMLGITVTELLGFSTLGSFGSISTTLKPEIGQQLTQSLDGCGNVPSTSNRTMTPASREEAYHPPRSPLEVLYEQTGNGTGFVDWVMYHVLRVYPHFPDEDAPMPGTPSVAHDPNTNRTVLGFRIMSTSLLLALRDVSFLMLCELVQEAAVTSAAAGAASESRATGAATWRCHDSGMENSYIPPECDARHWKSPAEYVMWGAKTVGPEDARLLLDEEGNLGATMVMRGCHPDTKWGNTTPIGSMYTMRWRRTHETWRVIGYPKLLDLRKHDSRPLGDAYPEITKSWISIPTRSGGSKVAGLDDPQGLHFSLGWTPGMKRHVVYQVNETSETLFAVTPLRKGVDYSRLDLGAYRGSTNVVQFKGALLGMGHRYSLPSYVHYWYAYCPHPPYYSAVALSDGFLLPKDPSVRTSYALGLAAEGDNLYLLWSEHDKVPRFSLHTSDDVMRSFRNSAFAQSRGHTYEGFEGFAAMCADAVAAENAEERADRAANRSSSP